MSYIKGQLEGVQHDSEIKRFLLKEGFKKDRNPFGYGECMRYVDNKDFTVWFCVHEKFIHLTQEYNCGGTMNQNIYYFEENNMDSFMKAYQYAVDWMEDSMSV